jgi:hypothetical protein
VKRLEILEIRKPSHGPNTIHENKSNGVAGIKKSGLIIYIIINILIHTSMFSSIKLFAQKIPDSRPMSFFNNTLTPITSISIQIEIEIVVTVLLYFIY